MINYIQKNEDKIRRRTNTSAPTSMKISYIITLDPLLEKMEDLVCMVGWWRTARVLSQRCCGEEAGHAVSYNHYAVCGWGEGQLPRQQISTHSRSHLPKKLLQLSGVITLPAPSTVFWMQVIRPVAVSVKAEVIQNSWLQSNHRIHGQTVQSLEWLLEEAVTWNS